MFFVSLRGLELELTATEVREEILFQIEYLHVLFE